MVTCCTWVVCVVADVAGGGAPPVETGAIVARGVACAAARARARARSAAAMRASSA